MQLLTSSHDLQHQYLSTSSEVYFKKEQQEILNITRKNVQVSPELHKAAWILIWSCGAPSTVGQYFRFVYYVGPNGFYYEK